MNEHSPDWNSNFYRQVQQTIQCEEYYPQDDTAQEDFMFDRLCELVEENVIGSAEAQDCFNDWILRRRPDTIVIHLGQTVARPFYE